MSYDIEFTIRAEKQFSKLELKIKEHILGVLDRIKIRPYSFAKKLVGTKYYKLRAGDYRIILDIRNERLIILILEIGHRKNIYKMLP
jgi:mRNA interferase RelE/StbE